MYGPSLHTRTKMHGQLQCTKMFPMTSALVPGCWQFPTGTTVFLPPSLERQSRLTCASHLQFSGRVAGWGDKLEPEGWSSTSFETRFSVARRYLVILGATAMTRSRLQSTRRPASPRFRLIARFTANSLTSCQLPCRRRVESCSGDVLVKERCLTSSFCSLRRRDRSHASRSSR